MSQNGLLPENAVFLGIVHDQGELKAEFGPLGFYDPDLKPPSTLLVTAKDLWIFGLSTIAGNDQSKKDIPDDMRTITDAARMHTYAIEALRYGDANLNDFDTPVKVPDSVIDAFIDDVQTNRGALKKSIENICRWRRNPEKAVDSEEKDLATKFLKAATKATQKLEPRKIPDGLQKVLEEDWLNL